MGETVGREALGLRYVSPMTVSQVFAVFIHSGNPYLLAAHAKQTGNNLRKLHTLTALTLGLTYRRRGGRSSANRMSKLSQPAERKARAAVRCRRIVGRGHLVSLRL